MAEQLLWCHTCPKAFKAPRFEPGRTYACRGCGDPLEPVSHAPEAEPSDSGDGPTPEDASDPLVGQRVGDYRILEKLGEGGMGAVYKAEHVGLRQLRALKVLPEHVVQRSKKAVGRFMREAQVAAALSHRNIVAVHTVDVIEGVHVIDMEFVEGESVQARLEREGRLDLVGATRVALEIARGLAAAHAKHIVHRDIKPGNVLLDRQGNVKVADFWQKRLDELKAQEHAKRDRLLEDAKKAFVLAMELDKLASASPQDKMQSWER